MTATPTRGTMLWDNREPCASCPYRRDARVGYWHPDEFRALLAAEADPLNGSVFGCHATRKRPAPSICAGWLLDQKRRGLPSIQLRLVLMRNDDAGACVRDVNDGGAELYESIEEMVAAQTVRPPTEGGATPRSEACMSDWIEGAPPGAGEWWVNWVDGHVDDGGEVVLKGTTRVLPVSIGYALLGGTNLLLKFINGMAFRYEPNKDRITHHQPLLAPAPPTTTDRPSEGA